MILGKLVTNELKKYIDPMGFEECLINDMWGIVSSKVNTNCRTIISEEISFPTWIMIATPTRNLIDNLKTKII